MAFKPNMSAAARRHLQAADVLGVGHRRDVAGYLYGIAAECAIKAMMLDLGLRPTPTRHDDPFFLHFPELRTVLLDRLQGRLSAPLSHFLTNHAFLGNWAVEMRYCKGDEVLDQWVTRWAAQAKDAVSAIGT